MQGMIFENGKDSLVFKWHTHNEDARPSGTAGQKAPKSEDDGPLVLLDNLGTEANGHRKCDGL